jgi:hypothetical protein
MIIYNILSFFKKENNNLIILIKLMMVQYMELIIIK